MCFGERVVGAEALVRWGCVVRLGGWRWDEVVGVEGEAWFGRCEVKEGFGEVGVCDY